ncbi:MAG: hypothetical protein ACUVV3_10370 [Dehalococcoidia bacterium]
MLRIKSTGNCDVKLYESDGQTQLLTQTLVAAATENSYPRWHHVKFNGEASLSKDTYYHLLVEPTTTTTNVELHYMDVDKPWYLEQMDGGQNFHYVEGAGTLSATPTRRPLISLELTAFDDGVTPPPIVTPVARTCYVSPDTRSLAPPPEKRILVVPAERRIM